MATFTPDLQAQTPIGVLEAKYIRGDDDDDIDRFVVLLTDENGTAEELYCGTSQGSYHYFTGFITGVMRAAGVREGMKADA